MNVLRLQLPSWPSSEPLLLPVPTPHRSRAVSSNLALAWRVGGYDHAHSPAHQERFEQLHEHCASPSPQEWPPSPWRGPMDWTPASVHANHAQECAEPTALGSQAQQPSSIVCRCCVVDHMRAHGGAVRIGACVHIRCRSWCALPVTAGWVLEPWHDLGGRQGVPPTALAPKCRPRTPPDPWPGGEMFGCSKPGGSYAHRSKVIYCR